MIDLGGSNEGIYVTRTESCQRGNVEVEDTASFLRRWAGLMLGCRTEGQVTLLCRRAVARGQRSQRGQRK